MTATKARPLKCYVAVYHYNATQDDELSLQEGDAIMVAETYPDSWMKGIRLRDMAMGVFPGNFVKSLPALTSTGEIVESKRCHVCKEILSSEMSYGRCLWQLEEAFAEPLKISGVISPEDYSKIFGHTQALVKLNEDLVGQLRMRMQTWDEEASLMGDIFLKRAPLLKLLEGYALQFPQARQVIERLRKTTRSFVLLTTNAEGATGQPLISFLMNPIQRAPRYEMLLKELLKNTPTCHKDYELTSDALTQVVKINTAMNENLRRMENEQRIIQISKSFPNDDTKILQASRQFSLGRSARKGKESSSKEEKFVQKRKRLSSFGALAGTAMPSSPGTPHRSPQMQRSGNRPRQHSEPVELTSEQLVTARKAASLKAPPGKSPRIGNAHFRFSLCLPDRASEDSDEDSQAGPSTPEQHRASTPTKFLSPSATRSPSSPALGSGSAQPSSGMTPSPSNISSFSTSSLGLSYSLPMSPSQQAIGSESLFDTSTQRFFIREGSVFLTGNAGVERYLFMFTDVLLISTVVSRSRKTYKLKERVPLSQCWVMNGKRLNRSFPNITIVLGTPLQMHNWVFLREEEKNVWLRDFERFVTEQKDSYMLGAIDETELPDEVFRFVTFKARSLMKPTLPMELELPANEEAMVIGFEGTNGKWQPALSTPDPDGTGVEWWFGAYKDNIGWFPVGCIPENDQIAFLNTQASQCKPVSITMVQQMKQLWAAETGKSMASLGSHRIARFYDASGSFKTTRVQDDSSADDLISAYYHHGLLYSGRSWDLLEVSVDETYQKIVLPDESPAMIVDRWGTKYRDMMKFYIKEQDDQPRSRLFTSSMAT